MSDNPEHLIRLQGPWQVTIADQHAKFIFDRAFRLGEIVELIPDGDPAAPITLQRQFNWPNPNSLISEGERLFLRTRSFPSAVCSRLTINGVEFEAVSKGVGIEFEVTEHIVTVNQLQLTLSCQETSQADNKIGPWELVIRKA